MWQIAANFTCITVKSNFFIGRILGPLVSHNGKIWTIEAADKKEGNTSNNFHGFFHSDLHCRGFSCCLEAPLTFIFLQIREADYFRSYK